MGDQPRSGPAPKVLRISIVTPIIKCYHADRRANPRSLWQITHFAS